MSDPRPVDEQDWARLYLLLTAVERAVDDDDGPPDAALQQLHLEHATLLGPTEPALPAHLLLRRELRYGRRLLDALYVGRPLEDRMLLRTQRPCTTLGCGNDALVRYCLSCEARRSQLTSRR
jgi:hypothetical protein